MTYSQPDILTYDNTDLFDALTKVFKPTDSVNASFLMDIYGLSRRNASIVVREWRRLNAA